MGYSEHELGTIKIFYSPKKIVIYTPTPPPLPPYWGSKGWHSGESARLPPMWPGFKSLHRRHMWVEFAPLLRKGTPVFPSAQKPTFSNSNSTRKRRRRTTLWMCYLQIIIYLFTSVTSQQRPFSSVLKWPLWRGQGHPTAECFQIGQKCLKWFSPSFKSLFS